MKTIYPEISKSSLNDAVYKLSDNLSTTRLNVLMDSVYCIISNSSCITLVIYSADSLPKKPKRCIRFHSNEAKKISQLLQLHEYVCNNLSASHSIYIGMELVKAEISIMMQQQFTQD